MLVTSQKVEDLESRGKLTVRHRAEQLPSWTYRAQRRDTHGEVEDNALGTLVFECRRGEKEGGEQKGGLHPLMKRCPVDRALPRVKLWSAA